MRYTDRLFELFKQVIIFYKEYNKNICVYIYLTEPLKTYEIMYIVAVSFISRTCRKSLTIVFTYCHIEYTGFELTTLVVTGVNPTTIRSLPRRPHI
jgi:hypothetical protein